MPCGIMRMSNGRIVVSNKLFERKAYSEMQDWKRNLADRYALMEEGARRVRPCRQPRRGDSSQFIDS